MKKLAAENIYYLRNAVWEFNSGLIFISIWALYYSVMQLSLFDISLIYVVITVSNVILEIPTGILADVYSRRLSVIVGGFFIGLAYVMLGLYPILAIAMIASFIEAIGDTCVSGALQAWITDEVGAERVGKVLLGGKQIAIPAHWVGVLLSIALAAWFDIQISIVLGGVMWFVLTIFLICFMPETNFYPVGDTAVGNWTGLRKQFGTALTTFAMGVRLVRGSPILALLFLAQFFGSIFFDSFYKFSRANILQGFSLPILALPLLGVLKENVWFGMLEMLQGLFSLVGLEVVRRTVDLNQVGIAARLLLGFTVFMLVGLLAFALTGNFALAIAAWLLVSGLQAMGEPISETWLNQNIPSNIRATVLSINSQVGMFGGMGGSTALGVYGDRFGVRRALGLSGVLLAPLLLIYARFLRVSPSSVKEP